MNKTVILYHKDCMDGMGSRYAAWKKFGDSAEYYACQYGKPLPDFEKGPEIEVFFLDYSTSRTELEALGEACSRVVVLDHHQTAQEALEGCNHPKVEIVFDMNRSGAVIAWEYFHPNARVPMLLQYIQDRDLWRFHLGEDTKRIHAGLGTLKGNMFAWNEYASHDGDYFKAKPAIMGGNPLRDVIERGKVLLDRDEDAVRYQVPQNVRVEQFMGYNCGFLNTGQLVSEMGHAMYSDETLGVDIGICWFALNDNQIVLSLRSEQGTDVDVSKIAAYFGGGGHKHAAGCRVTFAMMESILKGGFPDGLHKP